MRHHIRWGLILSVAGIALLATSLHWVHGVHSDAVEGFLFGFLGVVLLGVLSGRLGGGRWRMKVWMWSRRFLGPR